MLRFREAFPEEEHKQKPEREGSEGWDKNLPEREHILEKVPGWEGM